MSNLDFWTNSSSHRVADNALGSGSRVADDVILNNVIGFDVKVWNPDVNDYVDLGYSYTGIGTSRFSSSGQKNVDLVAKTSLKFPTYDTWSTHYESAGRFSGDSLAGRATNGIDNVGASGSANGIVDDADEKLTSPPCPYPLRGIQVKIRIFEPDSRQVREVTVVQDFLPQ